MNYAPIALFVYNRLWHTQQTVEALLKNVEAADSDLIIFSDAAKDESGKQKVDEVQQYLRTIKGFKSVRIVEREKNFGLAKSIISGVTEVVGEFGRVIVLEDDLITSPYFLRYINSSLEHYQHDARVMQISGHMFPVTFEEHDEMFFLHFTTTWGWATWSRAWKYFDENAAGYQTLKRDKVLKKKFDLDGAYRYFDMLEKQLENGIDSWGIRWYLSVFMNQGLVLYPARTLVTNQGMDGSGVHCGKSDFLDGNVIDSDFFPQSFPSKMQVNAHVFMSIKRFLNDKGSLANKLMKSFSRFSRRL